MAERAVPEKMADLSPEAERLLRWLHHHRGDRRGEEMLQAAMDEGAVPDQGEFGRALLELAREHYLTLELDCG